MNQFWSENPEVLITDYTSFFPLSTNSMIQNLNSIVRLLCYISIMLVLYTKNSQYLLLSLLGFVVTYIIYVYYPDRQELFYHPKTNVQRTLMEMKNSNKRKSQKKCTKPTLDNPFMNFNYVTDDYKRKPACKAFLCDNNKSLKLQDNISNKFNKKLYRDVSDLYSKNNSQREFYSIAYDGIPDQTSFAKWLFKTQPTCKERGLNCAPYTGSLL